MCFSSVDSWFMWSLFIKSMVCANVGVEMSCNKPAIACFMSFVKCQMIFATPMLWISLEYCDFIFLNAFALAYSVPQNIPTSDRRCICGVFANCVSSSGVWFV